MLNDDLHYLEGNAQPALDHGRHVSALVIRRDGLLSRRAGMAIDRLSSEYGLRRGKTGHGTTERRTNNGES